MWGGVVFGGQGRGWTDGHGLSRTEGRMGKWRDRAACREGRTGTWQDGDQTGWQRDGRVAGQTDRQTGTGSNGQMDAWRDGQLDRQMQRGMDDEPGKHRAGWTDRWTDRCREEWTAGWTDGCDDARQTDTGIAAWPAQSNCSGGGTDRRREGGLDRWPGAGWDGQRDTCS